MYSGTCSNCSWPPWPFNVLPVFAQTGALLQTLIRYSPFTPSRLTWWSYRLLSLQSCQSGFARLLITFGKLSSDIGYPMLSSQESLYWHINRLHSFTTALWHLSVLIPWMEVLCWRPARIGCVSRARRLAYRRVLYRYRFRAFRSSRCLAWFADCAIRFYVFLLHIIPCLSIPFLFSYFFITLDLH